MNIVKAKFAIISFFIIFVIWTWLEFLKKEQSEAEIVKPHYRSIFEARSIMCSFGWGRLGNQMSVFATLYAIEQKEKIVAYITAKQAQMLMYYFKLEKILPKLRILEQHYPNYQEFNWIAPFPSNPRFSYSINYTNRDLWDQISIGYAIEMGLFDNEVSLYYKSHIHDLKSIFEFKDHFKKSAENSLTDIKLGYLKSKQLPLETRLTFVSIHVRKTDYMQHLNEFYNSSYVESEYFRKSIEFLRSKYHQDKLLFYVVTDDVQWAISELERNHDDVIVFRPKQSFTNDPYNLWSTSFDIGHDLALLSLANHSILSYGTFGMWGSFLADSQTLIAPTKMMTETKEGFELGLAQLPHLIQL